MRRSRIKPVKLNERTAADVKLIDALEDWCEATTKTCYGEAALLDFGPSLIMSTSRLAAVRFRTFRTMFEPEPEPIS